MKNRELIIWLNTILLKRLFVMFDEMGCVHEINVWSWKHIQWDSINWNHCIINSNCGIFSINLSWINCLHWIAEIAWYIKCYKMNAHIYRHKLCGCFEKGHTCMKPVVAGNIYMGPLKAYSPNRWGSQEVGPAP